MAGMILNSDGSSEYHNGDFVTKISAEESQPYQSAMNFADVNFSEFPFFNDPDSENTEFLKRITD